MNDELEQIRDEANDLILKVGEVLDDNSMGVVHMVLARLFVDISIDSGNDKSAFMDMCEKMWDMAIEDRAEETKH